MAKKFLYSNSNGLYEEASAAVYEPSDFINASAGAGDAGKPIVLDAGGKFDESMYEFATVFTIDSADAKPVKADDLASTGVGKGASIIGLRDVAGNFVSNNLEGALAEISNAQSGVVYTADTGGVSAGDVVEISSDDTVAPYSNLANPARGIGVAITSETAGNPVVVARNDTVVPGVLSSAVAGTPYYWNGTALVSSIPSGSGSHVWQAGVAKNADDLHVEVRFVKKNS